MYIGSSSSAAYFGSSLVLIAIACVFAAILIAVYWWLFVDSWHYKKHWKTLPDLYHLYRGEDSIFFGLVVSCVASFVQFCLYWLSRTMCRKLFDVSGIVSNGYFLVFLSPFVLVYWCVVGMHVVLVALLYFVFGTFGMLPMLLAWVWALLFELPASVLNRKRGRAAGEEGEGEEEE